TGRGGPCGFRPGPGRRGLVDPAGNRMPLAWRAARRDRRSARHRCRWIQSGIRVDAARRPQSDMPRDSRSHRMNQSAVVQYALSPLSVELRDVAVPEIGEDDVLLRVGAVSVCGSDVHQAYNTHSWPVNVPVVLGHEFAGTVAKTGRRVRGFAKAIASSP